jgi:transcriptional regulator with XRE-family HTH domain
MVIETFSKVLRELRLKNKLSQEKLAELCDLDRTYISLLERGLRQPTLITIFKLASALNLSASEFIKQIEFQNS